MTQTDRLRLAVFIDFDNIEIGVKNTLNERFDVGLVLDALKERGEVVSKTAYSDWQRAGGYSRALTQHAIRMVQRNPTPGGDKNGADINLALDALEMAFTHPHINAFVIVGGDSDFISLVEKLKQYDKTIFVVGGRQFTSVIMQRNCHEFIAYENLLGAGGGRRAQSGEAKTDRTAIDQVIPLVKRALKVLSERDVSPQLGLLKTTLLQLDSTFSEKSYGAGSFREFAQKLEKLGVLRVQQSKGGWLVGPADGTAIAAESAVAPADDAESAPAPAATNGRPASERGGAVASAGAPADGVREFARILARAQVRRWPLYLRNVKQVIRQVSATFDERAYGFANLTDLLRAAQKANVVRIERDRQGVIRVFQGTALGLPAGEAEAEAPAAAAESDIEPIEAGEPIDVALAASSLGAVVVPESSGAGADESGAVHAAADEASAAEAAGEAERERPRRRARRPKAAPRARAKTTRRSSDS
ncbi:MAG TPA: NYN domain-containing protein [Vicinamibacterales bacterium]|nr:NYN domain-containing protein [Vicinamibacterales bacterium]